MKRTRKTRANRPPRAWKTQRGSTRYACKSDAIGQTVKRQGRAYRVADCATPRRDRATGKAATGGQFWLEPEGAGRAHAVPKRAVRRALTRARKGTPGADWRERVPRLRARLVPQTPVAPVPAHEPEQFTTLARGREVSFHDPKAKAHASQPNTVYMEIVSMGGMKLAIASAPHGGTPETIRRAAKDVRQAAFETFQDASNMNSRTLATGPDGQAAWEVSPNFEHVDPIRSERSAPRAATRSVATLPALPAPAAGARPLVPSGMTYTIATREFPKESGRRIFAVILKPESGETEALYLHENAKKSSEFNLHDDHGKHLLLRGEFSLKEGKEAAEFLLRNATVDSTGKVLFDTSPLTAPQTLQVSRYKERGTGSRKPRAMAGALAGDLSTACCAEGYVERADLGAVLSAVAPLLKEKTSFPIDNTVLLSTLQDGVGVSLYRGGYDRVHAGIVVPGHVTTPGAAVVPLEALREAAKARGDLRFVAVDDTTTRLGDRTVQTARGVGLKNYQELPQGAWMTVGSVAADDLATLLRRVEYARSNDSTRPHLEALHLKGDGQTLLGEATDGHRLARATCPMRGSSLDVLVPSRVVETLLTMLRTVVPVGDTVHLAVAKPGGWGSLEASSVSFTFRNGFLHAAQVDATFPSIEFIFKVKRPRWVTLSRLDLLSALDALVAADPSSRRSTALELTPSSVKVSTTVGLRTLSVPELPVVASGGMARKGETRSFTVGVNARYLHDALAALGGPSVTLEFGDALDSLHVRGEGDAVGAIQPMRMNPPRRRGR